MPATSLTTATAAPVAPEIVPGPEIHEVAPQREAWESLVEVTPAISDSAAEPIAEAYPDVRPRSVTDEVAQIELPEEAPPVFTELALDFDQAGLRTSDPVSVPTPDPGRTAEVPAYTAEVPAYVDDIAEEAATVAPPRKAFETPIFVAPTSRPAVESLIDEVDAAFITAGLPSGNDGATDHAVRAAEMLERIARRLRSGELRLQLTSESNTASEEAALAAVLAALLANR